MIAGQAVIGYSSDLLELIGYALSTMFLAAYLLFLRVTPGMLAAHPTGWSHQLLRLEPLRLVGRPGDPSRPTVSLYERPVEVFADALGSGLYNTHGDYLTAFETYSLPTISAGILAMISSGECE